MRNILLASASVAILVATAVGASAADLPGRRAPIAPAPIYSTYNWSGLYVGLNAGGTFGNSNRCGSFAPYNNATGIPVAGFLPNCGISGARNSGFTGGGQIGYNWQSGSFVYGIEGDIDFLNGRRRNGGNTIVTGPTAPAQFAGTYVVSNGSGNNGNVFGTARLRAGYAFDRFLVYVTGGAAFGGRSIGSSTAAFYPAPLAVAPGNQFAAYSTGGGNNNSRVGYALGAGAEYALTNNWSIKGEYLYANFGSGRGNRAYACTNVNLGILAGTCGAQAGNTFISTGRSRNDFSLLRVGVNYKF